MSSNPRIETEEDLQLVKEFVLLPILLDMLERDINRLKSCSDGVIFNHVIFYLREVDHSILLETQQVKASMRKRDVKILSTETNALGIEIDYKVRGYNHHFKMLRSLVKAELMTMLMNLGRRRLP
ncbi:hypothetical protein [Paenibacillus eucommiae]|uniref:Uncharacterized protein n=1 Tax=Paenibacillus eucommiae TaxID=1355755 RepID=A0ABS4J767_9BACL|nr:hypothetical protein [Paenibacillus eucommiae]MBP1995655.1 hypothetical protein [Paenibacillus eucommiae]